MVRATQCFVLSFMTLLGAGHVFPQHDFCLNLELLSMCFQLRPVQLCTMPNRDLREFTVQRPTSHPTLFSRFKDLTIFGNAPDIVPIASDLLQGTLDLFPFFPMTPPDVIHIVNTPGIAISTRRNLFESSRKWSPFDFLRIHSWFVSCPPDLVVGVHTPYVTVVRRDLFEPSTCQFPTTFGIFAKVINVDPITFTDTPNTGLFFVCRDLKRDSCRRLLSPFHFCVFRIDSAFIQLWCL